MLRSMTSATTRIGPLDAVLTAVFVVLAVLYMAVVIDDEGGSWAAVPLFTLLAVPLLWRRMSPLAALAGLVVAVGVHVVAFGTLTRCGLFLPVELLLVFAAAARLPWRMALAGWVLAIGAACLLLGFDESAPLDEAGVFVGVLVTIAWVAGAVLRLVAARATAGRGMSLEPARS